MRVGIDISPLTAQRTGVGNYCYYLLKHLLSAGDCTFHGFSSGRRGIALGELAGKLRHRHVPIPTRVLYRVWDWAGAPTVDRLLGGVDVYHATNYYLGPVSRARTVVTIHDLAFMVHPELCSPKIVGPFSKGMAGFARRADAIMAYSESTKRDVVRQLGVGAEKVTVAPMAVDEGFAPMGREAAEAYVGERYGVRPPYLLFVSTLEPRKNVPTLIRAFETIAADYPHSLVLIGGVGWNAGPILQAIEDSPVRERIIRPGFVPHMKLPAFYCAADAFVFPTLYEGFGLPLLEALLCGCPVVAAENSSVPEVTGGAALLSDAMDVDGIASNVMRVLDDGDLREKLVARGKAHAAGYSWHACAETTLDVYRGLAS